MHETSEIASLTARRIRSNPPSNENQSQPMPRRPPQQLHQIGLRCGVRLGLGNTGGLFPVDGAERLMKRMLRYPWLPSLRQY